MSHRSRFAAAVAALSFAFAPSTADGQVFWTDWTTAGAGYVDGSLSIFSQAVGVRYAGPYVFAQTNGGGYSWNFPIYDVAGPGTRPSTTDLVALTASGRHSISFDAPVLNPFLAIMSLGRTNLPVTYGFSDPFAVVSEGLGQWGDGWYTVNGDNTALTGYEYHGVLQFNGAFTELTWTSSPDEYWHGITVGVAGTVTPEPSTVVLLATGLFALAVVARRRRRDLLDDTRA